MDTKNLLQRLDTAPAVYASLQQLKRTGWVMNGVTHPESVKEHTEALIALAYELMPLLTKEEVDGLVAMLEVHDWPEALHGDEVIAELRPGERKKQKAVKFEKEQRALELICKDLSDREEIMSLWLRFETASDQAAEFARQLDKYQAVEQALEYEITQGIELFEEFLVYSINFINHSILLARIERLQAAWQLYKNQQQ